jgi:hypothetical protein
MKLKSLNKYISFLILLLFLLPVYSEEQIDIWNKNKKKISEEIEVEKDKLNLNANTKKIVPLNNENQFKIENKILDNTNELKVFGIYEPADNGYNLNMWSQTNPDNLRSSMSRIKKIKLSRSATNLFENMLFSFAYPPPGMDDEEFIDFKINWMIDNKKTNLIEKFLKQNDTFYNKKKVIQYLVDVNIAKANIKKGCEKINFVDKNIKDPYLEKFKIYCLIFNDKKNEAQLLYDILREQKQSDKFFDDKINFLFGIKSKTDGIIKDDTLLNFYLSSITNENFKYEPKNNTKKIIWEYLNAANLIKLDNLQDKEKLKSLEIAANQDQFDKQKIFDIYKKITFDLNSLVNAENIYQSLSASDARALIYQKFLLSDNNESKVRLLFLLKDLFAKEKLSNVYKKILSNKLNEINLKNVPDAYHDAILKNILINEENIEIFKIKYNDKILHRSRIIRYFTENTNKKKIEKDLNKIYKKIKRDRKYFFSAKDLALIESFVYDGIKIPKDLNYKEISKKYNVPPALLQLAKNDEPAFLTLKIVEIVGEDEIFDLDPETIYFISHLLNETNLKKIRNKVLISALPLRS